MNTFSHPFFNQVCSLFEQIPGVCFYVKDRELRYLTANRNLLVRYGLASTGDIINRSDSDFHPENIVANYELDENRIMQSAESSGDKVMPFRTRYGSYELRTVIRHPLLEQDGSVSGIITVACSLDQKWAVAQNSKIAIAQEWIVKNLANPFRVEDLASEMGVSSRQLRRIFKKEAEVTVVDFMTRSRVMRASELLRSTNLPIGDIAIQVGFCDQSALSRNFKKYLGCTPGQFRN